MKIIEGGKKIYLISCNMPELPEVQTTVDGIEKYAKGLRIKDAWTDYPKRTDGRKRPTSYGASFLSQIKNESFFIKFKKGVIGTNILGAERRAKNVLIHLSNNKTILIHMKMTGHVLYGTYKLTSSSRSDLGNSKRSGLFPPVWIPTKKGPLQDPFNKFIHLVLTLSNGKHLALSDMRKFAKVTLIDTPTLFESTDLAGIGPEPLEVSFTAKVLADRLATKPSGKIKTVLMDQSVVAGIGNIYSDEILWASNIHPLSITKKLSKKDIDLIWKNTKIILKKGIDFGGDSMSDYRNLDGLPGKFQYQHKAYRQTGKPCSKKGCCGTIHRLKIGGRSSHFCPVHQKLIS